MPERARQLAQDRVADDHRGELAAGHDVAADRERLGAEVVDDPLVEALVAAAQQRERLLRGELRDDRVVEDAAAGRERDHAAARAHGDRVLAVARAERRLDDVDPQHHPGAAAERRVVDLARLQRRRRAVVDAVERRAQLERVGHVALPAEPVEPGREQREDVDLHPRSVRAERTGGRRVATARPGAQPVKRGASVCSAQRWNVSTWVRGRVPEPALVGHAGDDAMAAEADRRGADGVRACAAGRLDDAAVEAEHDLRDPAAAHLRLDHAAGAAGRAAHARPARAHGLGQHLGGGRRHDRRGRGRRDDGGRRVGGRRVGGRRVSRRRIGRRIVRGRVVGRRVVRGRIVRRRVVVARRIVVRRVVGRRVVRGRVVRRRFAMAVPAEAHVAEAVVLRRTVERRVQAGVAGRAAGVRVHVRVRPALDDHRVDRRAGRPADELPERSGAERQVDAHAVGALGAGGRGVELEPVRIPERGARGVALVVGRIDRRGARGGRHEQSAPVATRPEIRIGVMGESRPGGPRRYAIARKWTNQRRGRRGRRRCGAPPTSTDADRVAHHRDEQLAAVRRARPRAPRTTAAAASAAPRPRAARRRTTAQPSSSCAQYSPASSAGARSAGTDRAARRAAPRPPRGPRGPRAGGSAARRVPARRSIRARPPVDQDLVAPARAAARRAASRGTSRRARAGARPARPRTSRLIPRCRRGRGGCPSPPRP